MEKRMIRYIFIIILSLIVTSTANAQDEGITLKLSRDFGYSSGAGDIQGLFSMKVTGPDDLVRVEFFIDETIIGVSTSAPFKFQFTTDDFPTGIHSIYAIGYTSAGEELHSRILTGNFVSAQEGWDSAKDIIIPVASILLLAILVSFILPLVFTRGKLETLPYGDKRNYGFRGGGICPKCHRPFALHLWGLNLGFSKFDRCPYCGKWSVVRAQSHSRLREAELEEIKIGRANLSMEFNLEEQRRAADESKYTNL